MRVTASLSDPIASVFVSYSHADKGTARGVAERLDDAGYRVWIDEGELRAGDSVIDAIASAIDRVDFLVALISESSVSSDWCRKELALAMTGEIAKQGITVIPLRIGDITMPPTLKDKLYLRLDAERLDSSVADLIRDMQRHLEPERPLPPRRRTPEASNAPAQTPASTSFPPISTFKLIGIDLEHLGRPRNDGTRGSALYEVPFNLDGTPDLDWATLLEHNWDRPPQFTSMHRPGISGVRGSTILLAGTTMDEVRRYHLQTLKLAVVETNRQYVEERERQRARTAAAAQAERQRLDEAQRITEDLDFD